MANQKSDQRKLAREYFLTTDKTQAEIAGLVGVNEKTLSLWKREDEWHIQKAATNVTPRKTIAGFLLQLENLRQHIDARKEGENFPTTKESDIIMKISKSIRMLNKALTLTDYINCTEEIIKFALNIDAGLAKQFLPIVTEFIQVKTKELKEE